MRRFESICTALLLSAFAVGAAGQESSADCPDPALEGVQVQDVTVAADGTYLFRVVAVVKNDSPVPWSSAAGRQALDLHSVPTGVEGYGARHLGSWDFPDIAANALGPEASYEVTGWRPGVTRPPAFRFSITYDPDNRTDGDPANDDCDPGNNSATITGEEIDRVLLKASRLATSKSSSSAPVDSDVRPSEKGVGRFAGTWEAAPCEARRYRRSLLVRPDGSFAATDYVSPCPPGKTCVWSGIVKSRGTWRQRNPGMIELTTTWNSSRAGEPVPGALAYDTTTDRLHEATPGAAMLCEYRRAGGAPRSAEIRGAEAKDRDIRCRDAGKYGPIMANEKVCAAQRVQDAERQLAEFIAETRAGLESSLATETEPAMVDRLEGELDALARADAHWQQYRDATCRYAYFQLYPGSMAQLEEYVCREALTRQRIEQLKKISSDAGKGIDY